MFNTKKFTFESPYDVDELIVKELNKIAQKFHKRYSTLVDWTKTDKKVIRTSATGLRFPVTVCVYNITIKIPVIKWKGYEYIATLKKECGDEKENQVFTSLDEDFSAYFDGKFRCDHCETNRFRKTVHLFRQASGKELMIASTCSKQYFGIDVANKIHKIFTFLAKDGTKSIFDKVFDKFWKKSCPFDTETFCKLCYGIITRDGQYISGGVTTGEADRYMSSSMSYLSKEIEGMRKEVKKILNLAKNFDYNAVVKYWKNKKDQDNFTNNVNVAFTMYHPQHGYLAWAVFDYMKNIEKFGQKVIQSNEKSQHLGDIGERIESEVTINNIRNINTRFGWSKLVEMIDKQGNVLNWWTSKSIGFVKGDCVRVSGIVKNHDEYKGVKNTTIKNCKMKDLND